MIRVEDLYKQYSGAEFPSVDHLSFMFEKGRIAGLLGPNGAGKTTTISIISGLIRSFEGEVHVMGKSIRQNLDEIKKSLGIVPQQIALYSNLSCLENLQYYAKLYGLKQAESKQYITELLERFGLSAHADKQIRHYSGGMKRRANIIASLLNRPQLLILDEPTAGVDVQSRSMILGFLKEYNEEGNSILYTSHLLDEAQALCHEVIIIDKGQLLIQGEPETLIRQHGATDLENLFLKLTGFRVRD